LVSAVLFCKEYGIRTRKGIVVVKASSGRLNRQWAKRSERVRAGRRNVLTFRVNPTLSAKPMEHLKCSMGFLLQKKCKAIAKGSCHQTVIKDIPLLLSNSIIPKGCKCY